MDTYLKNQPAVRQFVAFIGLAAGFFVLNIVLSSLMFSDLSSVLSDKSATITPATLARFKWAQLFSSVVIFICPALLFGYFSSPRLFSYVGMQKRFSLILVLLAIGLLFTVQPLVSWLGNLNSHLNFGNMQVQLKQMEEMYNRAIETFLKMTSVTDLVINLLVIALLPAVAEELFFRGAMQKVLLRVSNKPWLAILLSSMVFALLHGTFFKIIPIFVLGILLGTVYHFTRNLWYTIIIHFLNNGLGVLSVYYADKSKFLKTLTDDKLAVPLYAAAFSLLVSIAIVYLMSRKSNEVLPAYLTDDQNDIID